MRKRKDEFVTRNLRLPEHLYQELKIEAAKKRMSLGALIRSQLHESFKRGRSD